MTVIEPELAMAVARHDGGQFRRAHIRSSQPGRPEHDLCPVDEAGPVGGKSELRAAVIRRSGAQTSQRGSRGHREVRGGGWRPAGFCTEMALLPPAATRPAVTDAFS